MKKTIALLLLLCAFAPAAHAQMSRTFVLPVTTLPASCTNYSLIWNLTQTDGSNAPGLYRCQSGAPVSVGAVFTGGAVSSPITFANGTAAAPSMAFTSDADGTGTGIFRSAANSIGFSTNGVERWVINSSGALNPAVNNTYDIGNGSVNPRDINLGRNVVFPDDVRQTFNPGTTNAGLNAGSIAGDPSAPSNGDLWYDSTANELTARINGANVALGAGGGGATTGEQLLSTTTFDANSTAWQDLYTVPSGKTLVVTRVVLRAATADLSDGSIGAFQVRESNTTANYSMGTVTIEALTNSIFYIEATPVASAAQPLATAANKVQAHVTAAYGDVATVTVDLFGYLY